MNLILSLLYDYLKNENVQITFPNLKLDALDIIKIESFCILREIQDIIQDDTLSDPECFRQIEAIVSVLEDHGIDCGARHDFG